MNEEMRKEFEEWIIKSNIAGSVPSFIMKNENGTYIDPQAVYLWFAWQASREAMKPIKLPKLMKNTQEQSCYYYNDAIEECKESIQQAGYKVEE
jgi:hypothetical protein